MLVKLKKQIFLQFIGGAVESELGGGKGFGNARAVRKEVSYLVITLSNIARFSMLISYTGPCFDLFFSSQAEKCIQTAMSQKDFDKDNMTLIIADVMGETPLNNPKLKKIVDKINSKILRRRTSTTFFDGVLR